MQCCLGNEIITERRCRTVGADVDGPASVSIAVDTAFACIDDHNQRYFALLPPSQVLHLPSPSQA